MTITNATTSASTDMYSWIGSSGGSWGLGSNWADVTSNTSPAGMQPGGLTPVLISGPTGATYEVITGGGTAASIVQTGLVNLLGTYSVGGQLAVGTPESVLVNAFTPGSLSLGTGSAVTAGAITLNSGTIALAGTGTSLSTSGSVAVGLAGGNILPNGSSYSYENAAVGVISIGAGASLTASGSVVVTDGSLLVNGTGASVSLGSLSLGMAPTSATFGPYGYTSPIYYSTPGYLSVGAGATVAVAGAVTAPEGTIAVSGTGARLSVGGTLSLQAVQYSTSALTASSGASIQAAGLAFQQFGATTATTALSVDNLSTVRSAPWAAPWPER